MRISDLLKREPFGKILEESLALYLKRRYGGYYAVQWFEEGLPKIAAMNSQTWLCNPYLNSIFLPTVIKDITLPVIQEFSRSTIWWRRPFQHIYVFFAVNGIFSKLFSKGGLSLTPGLPNAINMLILGGNHHLRILDWESKTCAVVLKNGENPDFMKTEISIRTSNPFLPCPQISEVADDYSWYSEPLIFGKPINRLESSIETEKTVNRILPALVKLYDKTLEVVDVDSYAEDIHNRIVSRIPEIARLDRTIADKALSLAWALLKLTARYYNTKLKVAQSHGDFHPANILKDGENAWLIDWEYSSRRQLVYDSLVYGLSSRFPQGLSERILQAIHSEKIPGPFALDMLLGAKWGEERNRRVMIALFLLEEMDLITMENANPLLFNFSSALSTFLEEVRKAIPPLQIV